MQFTPQQLSGAQRYNPHTRIGNWLEDVRLEETKVAEFRQMKASGQLAIGARQGKLNTCTAPAQTSSSSDGSVRFGDTVVLVHCETRGSLSNDLWEETCHSTDEYMVSVCPDPSPVARNTFKIVRVESGGYASRRDYEDSDCLHYGESFQLECSELLAGDDNATSPHYLGSATKTHSKASRVSNRQSVYMTQVTDSSIVWKVDKVADSDVGSTRLLSQHETVPANEPIVVRHRSTNQALFCEPRFTDSTEFGEEFEACCFNQTHTGKKEGLCAETQGLSTGATAMRGELAGNLWVMAMQ